MVCKHRCRPPNHPDSAVATLSGTWINQDSIQYALLSVSGLVRFRKVSAATCSHHYVLQCVVWPKPVCCVTVSRWGFILDFIQTKMTKNQNKTHIHNCIKIVITDIIISVQQSSGVTSFSCKWGNSGVFRQLKDFPCVYEAAGGVSVKCEGPVLPESQVQHKFSVPLEATSY